MIEKDVILVVEDNEDNSNLVVKVLTHAGYSVHVTSTGEAAIEWCDQYIPRLILMDLSLPKMDGLEATRSLRSRAAFADIPIIALSAHAMKGWEDKANEAGCTEFVSKPIMPRDLTQVVDRFLKDDT